MLRRTTFCYPDSFGEPADFGTADHLPQVALAEAAEVDALDGHIEAHVHGPLRLDTDVETLVLDPVFRGTGVEAAAATLPFPTSWHHGFRLPVAVLAEHAGFRGEDAVRAGTHDPQPLECVRHRTARFGLPDGADG